jgi:hypothetical protein
MFADWWEIIKINFVMWATGTEHTLVQGLVHLHNIWKIHSHYLLKSLLEYKALRGLGYGNATVFILEES